VTFLRDRKAFLAGLLVLALAAPLALAQKAKHKEPQYDRSTETTLSATIEEVSTPKCPMMAQERGMHLTVKAGEETLVVHLGPAALMEEYGFAPKKGDTVEVTGSRVRHEEKDSLLARRIVAGNVTVTLRDEQGKPVWEYGKHAKH
jgi:hypothetical protein